MTLEKARALLQSKSDLYSDEELRKLLDYVHKFSVVLTDKVDRDIEVKLHAEATMGDLLNQA